MKFTLDIKLAATLNFSSAPAAAGHSFGQAVFAVAGVAAVFGVNDFVTVTREPDAPWEPIIAAVQAAASAYL